MRSCPSPCRPRAAGQSRGRSKTASATPAAGAQHPLSQTLAWTAPDPGSGGRAKYLTSSTFHVAGGALDVDVGAAWIAREGGHADSSPCPAIDCHVSLELAGASFDRTVATRTVTIGRSARLRWSNLEPGEYYLRFWTAGDTPNCRLKVTVAATAQP